MIRWSDEDDDERRQRWWLKIEIEIMSWGFFGVLFQTFKFQLWDLFVDRKSMEVVTGNPLSLFVFYLGSKFCRIFRLRPTVTNYTVG